MGKTESPRKRRRKGDGKWVRIHGKLNDWSNIHLIGIPEGRADIKGGERYLQTMPSFLLWLRDKNRYRTGCILNRKQTQLR